MTEKSLLDGLDLNAKVKYRYSDEYPTIDLPPHLVCLLLMRLSNPTSNLIFFGHVRMVVEMTRRLAKEIEDGRLELEYDEQLRPYLALLAAWDLLDGQNLLSEASWPTSKNLQGEGRDKQWELEKSRYFTPYPKPEGIGVEYERYPTGFPTIELPLELVCSLMELFTAEKVQRMIPERLHMVREITETLLLKLMEGELKLEYHKPTAPKLYLALFAARDLLQDAGAHGDLEFPPNLGAERRFEKWLEEKARRAPVQEH